MVVSCCFVLFIMFLSLYKCVNILCILSGVFICFWKLVSGIDGELVLSIKCCGFIVFKILWVFVVCG